MTAPRPSDTDLAEHIRSAGLRATAPRIEVLGQLHEHGHLTALEVADALRRRGIDVARMSVYNVLNNLTRVGVLSAVELGPGGTVYEVGHGRHHHFVCRNCGRVIDVPPADDQPSLRAELPGVEVDEVTVVFRGRCERCTSGA